MGFGQELRSHFLQCFPAIRAEIGDDLPDALLFENLGARSFRSREPIATIAPVLAVLFQDTRASEDAGQGVVVAGGDGIEEVIVTAERREASVQDTSISITALFT